RQLTALTCMDIAFELAFNDYRLGIHICTNLAVGPDHQLVTRQFDAAFNLAIHVNVFAAGEFSLNNHRLANVGKFCRFRRLHRFCPPGAYLRHETCASYGNELPAGPERIDLRGKPVNFRERHSTSPNYIPQRPLEQPHKPGISSETGWLSRF